MKALSSITFALTCFFVTCVFATSGCKTGRIKTSEDGNIVGTTRAGTATYDQLIQNATDKLLQQTATRAVNHSGGPMRVAFGGVINKSAEQLGDIREAINQSVETVVTNSQLYAVINQLFVKAALREIQVSGVDKLFLAKYRRQFLSVLEEEGQVPDYLIIATLTSSTTKALGYFRDRKERVYNMTLDMINAKSGITEAKVMEKVTKEYRT